MYSLTAYFFTQSHIAECIKCFIMFSIIQRKQKKTIPPGHSNTVASVVNSIIGPCNTVVSVVKVLASQAGSVRYSDRSIFRQVYIPTGLYSDRSIFRQVDIPTGRYSDRSLFRQIYIPTCRYSNRSLFRQFLDVNYNVNYSVR